MAVKTQTPISDERGNLSLSNVQIMNTVRKYAPADFQSRIPVATQGNIAAVLGAMNQYQPNWDIFWNVFVGRIGRVNINDRMNFTNPLAKLKQPSLEYGRTMQEIQTNLIRARKYDPNGQNVFGREGREPEIFVNYHTQSRDDKYEINIPMKEVLNGSFVQGESISSFWNGLTDVPVKSANFDEYLLMRELLATYDKNHQFYNVQTDDLAEKGLSFEERQQRGALLIERLNREYGLMKFMSTKYSVYGRDKGLISNCPRVIAFISVETDALLKTITTAYAFNQGNQKILADEVIVLDEIPIPGCQAILIDEAWYQCADTLGPLMLGSPLNPDNMSYNYFYHIWQILSYSLFLGSAMFSTRPDTSLNILPSTVTGVTIKDGAGKVGSTVSAGGVLPLFATVAGTNDPNQAVKYEIKAFDGKGAGLTLPAECYIDSNAVFHSGSAKSVDKFIIAATSIQNPSFSATYAIQIEGAKYVATVNATNQALEQGQTTTVPVTVTPADATDGGWNVYSVDGLIAIGNVMTSSFQVTAQADTPLGTHELVIVSAGGDPASATPTKTVTITVTAPPIK